MSGTPRQGREPSEIRPTTIELSAAPYAEGSCIISTGRTRVLCTASVEETLPDWRRGSGKGWVTAEYAMLPRATHTRTGRERSKLGGRTQEIQRLIGRALRACIDLRMLGERSILIDCDVLVADGGTRTAAVTGAAVALHQACRWLVTQQKITSSPMKQLVAAVSVGVINGEPRLDLEYSEDVAADVDLNLVVLEDGGLVEVQGTAEKNSYNRRELDQLLDLGMLGIHHLLEQQRRALQF
ncbi:MAG: ribonuclease PH [Gemmatimonadota bacterium]